MEKTRCIDCENCIELFLDCHGYLNNDCKKMGVIFFSLEKWYCDEFESTDNKAKICNVKGSKR